MIQILTKRHAHTHKIIYIDTKTQKHIHTNTDTQKKHTHQNTYRQKLINIQTIIQTDTHKNIEASTYI